MENFVPRGTSLLAQKDAPNAVMVKGAMLLFLQRAENDLTGNYFTCLNPRGDRCDRYADSFRLSVPARPSNPDPRRTKEVGSGTGVVPGCNVMSSEVIPFCLPSVFT